MSAPTSEEIALDFKDCLNDLQINNIHEIKNLTIIAKENIEHAQALSRALESHIKTTAPSRKLPALYVLDSIVKNVGSPYTIYLGRNLFSTFFDAYTLVDPRTRQSMEALLKTWKQPVAGSVEPTPVFPAETTRMIENALIKARTAALQTQRPQPGLIGRPSSVNYRDTPTPPQQAPRYGTPSMQSQAYQNGHLHQQSVPQHRIQQPAPDADMARSIIAALAQQNQQPNDVGRLQEDINNLISNSQADFARNPYDQGIQQRLKALLDLQTIVRTQQLSPETIGLIKAQVTGLSAAARPVSTQQTANPFLPPQPAWQPPTASAQSWQPPPVAQPYNQVQPTQAPPLPAGFAPSALDALLKSTVAGQKPSTPQLQAALPTLQSLPLATYSPRPHAAVPHLPQGNALLDALRGVGITPQQAAPSLPIPPPIQASNTTSTADLLKSLQNIPGFANFAAPPALPVQANSSRPRIPLSQSSLKTFRPDLITTLYTALPNQCTTCGRRFPATAAGQTQKGAHIDWHFRTNNRIADNVHKSLNRSWFIDEKEWIELIDDDPSSGLAPASVDETGVGPAAAKKDLKKKIFIRAPMGVDANRINKECPICTERFEAVRDNEVEDWVWMDVEMVAGRAFHVSCREEVRNAKPSLVGGIGGGHARTGSGALAGVFAGQQRSRSSTPETLLGKRKAEDPLAGLKAKLKT